MLVVQKPGSSETPFVCAAKNFPPSHHINRQHPHDVSENMALVYTKLFIFMIGTSTEWGNLLLRNGYVTQSLNLWLTLGPRGLTLASMYTTLSNLQKKMESKYYKQITNHTEEQSYILFPLNLRII